MKDLLRITFLSRAFFLCPSTIIAQVPCSGVKQWTEDLINAEITFELWFSPAN